MSAAKNILLAFLFSTAWFLPSSICRLGVARAANSNETQDSSDSTQTTIDRETLNGRRFQFSWKSADGGGVNGIAWLKEDGTIQGIASPNESTWLVDASGHLLFKHADGRVSTRYEQFGRTKGVLWCEGPFLFREGISHRLVEIPSPTVKGEHRITTSQAAKINYSTQQFLYLDPGESCVFQLRDGTKKQIHLVSVTESKDLVIGLTRHAEVKAEIDGKPIGLTCAPYVMPIEVDKIRIQADTSSAWLSMPKRVQFSIWDAADPIVDTNLFCFPLPGYRLFSHGMQAYNEPVHLGHRDGDPAGQRFHHNYGTDLAGYEARQKVVSAITGRVVQVDPGEGDLSIRDDRGFVLYYGHLDSILSGIRVGTLVQRGQWVAMLGRRGASGNFSHLHVGVFLSEEALAAGQLNRNLNLYPWLIAAYQAEHGLGLYAVARPHQTARTDDPVVFNGAHSLAFGSQITSFRWEFPDGSTLHGPRVEKVFDKPGCYSATLRVQDNREEMDVDFCTVRVFSRSALEEVMPTLFVTFTPSDELRINQPAYFRIWPQGGELERIQIDFGDGTVLRDYRPYSAVTHRFAAPGIHIVTVTAQAGTLPVMQKTKVVVQP